MLIMEPDFEVNDVQDGVTIHQRCLLLSGQCKTFDRSHDDFISVCVTDTFDQPSPTQNWPVVAGKWKALIMLNTGQNKVDMSLHHAGTISKRFTLNVVYQPLLQLPPLHLAIMVAKDSPLLIDCPPAKRGAISTAHSTLEAAMVKFRMAAYMWQALTAEDLRSKGLGRRAFRLEEEWGVDTTSCTGSHTDSGFPAFTGASAKIHVIRSERTVAELRDDQVAQQNENGGRRDDLHKYFEEALKSHGSPFTSAERPVVAGLILDSHYSVGRDLILGHAALGRHNPEGISLGVFGSHTTYSWPRFMEEVPACLLDATATGDSVGNDNGECGTMSGACFVGQGAFLHEVGHAFGADHTTGIMARGYSQHWSRNFIADNSGTNDARWDLEDALRFRQCRHFRLPGEREFSLTEGDSAIVTRTVLSEDEQLTLEISCQAGIARIEVQTAGGDPVELVDFRSSLDPSRYALKGATFDGRLFRIGFADLEGQFDRTKELSMSILGMHGHNRLYTNIWKLLADSSFVRIPGHNMRLGKKSSKSGSLDESSDNYTTWAMLLNRKLDDGKLDPVRAIDLRVGCIMDGAVLHYKSGVHVNCGPVNLYGGPHTFGGHASAKQSIRDDDTIVKVEVNTGGSEMGSLEGIRMTLHNGKRWGELNASTSRNKIMDHVEVLEPADDERIVGFYGKSDNDNGFTHEFGIITAKKDEELPHICYDMPELKNEGDDLVSSSIPKQNVNYS